jgi:hypothetical protein
MKIKLLVLMLLVTALALASRQPVWAYGVCVPDNCIDLNAACANNGGNPTLPVNIGQFCETLPSHTVYDLAIASCQYPNGSETFRECYW